jgi:serine/threonine-protein kinase HipA
VTAATARHLTTVMDVVAADVHKAGRPAARLRRTPDGVEFSYRDDYLAAPDARPVATTLPLDDRPVVTPAGAVPPFFAGLLPESRRLSALRRAVKTSADDELALPFDPRTTHDMVRSLRSRRRACLRPVSPGPG